MRKPEDGWVISWFIVLAPVLLMFLGLVLDGGILLLHSQKLDAASDAAALAASDAWDREYWKWHGKVRIDRAGAERLARQYLNRNLPGARLVRVTVSPANRVNVRTEVTVPLTFMRLVGRREQRVESFSTAVRKDI